MNSSQQYLDDCAKGTIAQMNVLVDFSGIAQPVEGTTLTTVRDMLMQV